MLKIFSVEIEKKTDLPNDKIDLLAFVTHPVPCSRRHMPQPKPRPPSPSLDQNVFTALQPPLFIIRLPVLIVKFGGGIIQEAPSEKRSSVEAERCDHCAETNVFVQLSTNNQTLCDRLCKTRITSFCVQH